MASMVSHNLVHLHETLVAVQGLLGYSFIAGELRERLNELKAMLEEELLSVLSESDVTTTS